MVRGTTGVRRSAVLAVLLMMTTPSASSGQGFVSPLVGVNLAGDSGCGVFIGCEKGSLDIGIAAGLLGSLFGVEFDLARSDDFFGETPNVTSRVLTMTGNVMVGPTLGRVRPYGVAGLGLIQTHVNLARIGYAEVSTHNQFGSDVGGGAIVLLSDHVGARLDLRYFHALQDLDIIVIPISERKLDFARAAAAVFVKF